jgi:hypothetical protein
VGRGLSRALPAAMALIALAVPPPAGAGQTDEGTAPRISFYLAPGPGPGQTSLVSGAAPFDLSREADPALLSAVQTIRADGAGLPPAAAESRPRPRLLRAWIEWGAFMAADTIQYWTSNSFPEDADFKVSFDDQIPRILFLDGVRFDSNQFSLNWSHILGGALYFQFGRTNHTSWLYATMMSVAGSTWWEVIGEPKEVIAINDQIITGLGGFALGEPWYQIANYLLHSPGWPERALAVLNPVLFVNRWLDRKDPAAKAYVQPGWHDFTLFSGARRLSTAGTATGTDLYLGFRAQLIGLPDYGRSGEVRRGLADTYFSEMTFDYATRGGHAEETRLFAKAVPWGLLDQKIGQNGRGHSLTLGLGSAFEFFKKRPLADYDAVPVPVKSDLGRLHLEEPRAFTDKLAILHIVGPVLDLTAFGRGVKFRTVIEGYADFALVNATALNDYSVTHSILGLKTTVFYYGYYYGFGGTGAASVTLDYKGFELRVRAELNAWGSADFLDRFDAEVTNNAHLTDSRVLYRGGLSWRLPSTPVRLFADLERVRRWGRLEEIRTLRVENKTYAGLAFTF